MAAVLRSWSLVRHNFFEKKVDLYQEEKKRVEFIVVYTTAIYTSERFPTQGNASR
jgi:hypothetical protein